MKKLKTTSFSRPQLAIFILVFGLVGYLIFRAFAAPNPNLPGDLNNDNTVNITDMSILLSNYGTSNSTADINGDGTVNVLDLSILLSHYGQTLSAKPSIPTGLTATPGDSQVTLTWSANPSSDSVDTYQVYWTTDSTWASNQSNLNVTGTSYAVTGLANGSTYYFRISAHNGAGYGGWSTAISASPQGAGGTGSGLGSKLPSRMPESSGTKVLIVSTSGSGTSCSLSTPCSLSQAWSLAVDGTIIELRAGSYGTLLDIEHKRFSSTNPVTMQSYPGETATFIGSSSSSPLNATAFVDDQAIRIRNLTFDAPYNVANIKISTSQHVEINHIVSRNAGINDFQSGYIVGGNGILVVSETGYTQPYSSDVQIWNSTITNWGLNETPGVNGKHGIYYGAHGAEYGVIANNVIYDGIAGFGLQLGGDASNNIITNNTIVHMMRSVNVGSGIVIWNDGYNIGTNNNLVVNNLLTNNVSYGIEASGGTSSGNVVRNNLTFANTAGAYLPTYGANVVFSLQSPSYAADPLYVDYAGKNYHLLSASPAIGKSDPAYTPPYDHDGNARGVAPNLGAY